MSYICTITILQNKLMKVKIGKIKKSAKIKAESNPAISYKM